MAFPLSGERELIDPHGGLDDLVAGGSAVLHERSFMDDPTRALRAARYAARFGFELERETERLLRARPTSRRSPRTASKTSCAGSPPRTIRRPRSA